MNILKYVFDAKYRFFARKVKAVTKQIWDYEFKVEKTMQIREGIRRDRDSLIDAQHKLEAAFKAAPNDKKVEADYLAVNDNIKRFEAQMKMLDDQINGVPANGDNPGENGVNDTIASLAELRQMYKQYLTKI